MSNTKTKNIVLKIAVFLLISHIFFIHWVGWGENARFDLTRALAEEQTIFINSYKNNTSDRVFFKGNYYSDKPPLVSLISAPLHSLIISSFPEEKIDENMLLKRRVGLTFIEEDLFLSFPIKLSMISLTILTSLLPHILTSLLVFQLSFKVLHDVRKSFILTLIYSFGTLAFPYSLIFFGNSLLTLLLFSSFFILFTQRLNFKNLFASGILLGISSLTDYLALFFLPAFIIYGILKTRSLSKVLIFSASVFLGLSLLLIYQYLIFNNPFEVTYKHTDQDIWTNVRLNTNYGIESFLPNLFKTYRITIDSYRGIFFYYPILFIFILGILKGWKIWKEEAILIFILLFTFIYFLSISWNWWGGTGFSIRFFSPLMPFLFFGAISLFKSGISGWFSKIFFFIATFSIFTNLLSLQGFEDIIEDPINLYPSESKKINSLSFIDSPLLTKYFNEFISKGPTPKLFNSFFYGSHSFLDIRDNIEQPMTNLLDNRLHLFNNFYIRTGFFLLTLNIFLFIFFFRHYFTENLIKIFISLGVLFLIFSYNYGNVYVEGCYREDSPNFRWCKDNYLTYLKLDNSTAYKLYIHLLPLHNINFNIKINGNEFDFVTGKYEHEVFSQTLDLKKGINLIEVSSDEKCGQLNELLLIENSSDFRCASFAIFNKTIAIPINEFYGNKIKVLYTRGWYFEEKDDKNISFRWMSDEGLIEVYSTDEKFLQLSFFARKFDHLNNTHLRIFTNGELISDENITKDWLLYTTKPLSVKNYTTIKFETNQCLYTHLVNTSDIPRCLGIAIGNFSLTDLTEFAKITPNKGLYQIEFDNSTNLSFWWSIGSSEFSIYSLEKIPANIKFYAKGIKDAILDAECNDDKTQFNITDTWNEMKLSCNLVRGENLLILKSSPCISPKKLNISQDSRCLSFAISEISQIKNS